MVGRSCFFFMTIFFYSFSDTTQMNNTVPTSPLLQQMGHPHSYPNLGQISNPYEQQPPGKELNKYASLKAVGKGILYKSVFFLLSLLYSAFPYEVFYLLFLFLYYIYFLLIYHLSIIYCFIYYLFIIYVCVYL